MKIQKLTGPSRKILFYKMEKYKRVNFYIKDKKFSVIIIGAFPRKNDCFKFLTKCKNVIYYDFNTQTGEKQVKEAI